MTLLAHGIGGIRDLPGIDLGIGATAHWVDVLYTDDNGTTNANKGMIVQDNGGVGAGGVAQPYRCVFALVQ